MRSPTARSSSSPAYRAGDPPKIAGVGQAISDKIDELARTGHLAFYDRLRRRGAADASSSCCASPGSGHGPSRSCTRSSASITSTTFARPPRPAGCGGLKGLSVKTEELDPRGHRGARGARVADAPRHGGGAVDDLIAELGRHRRPVSIEPAGSFRRRRETIGDLDLLAETTNPAALFEQFTGLASVDGVLMSGSHKAAVRLLRGPQVDLMVMPPGTAGTYRIHFTGPRTTT